MNNLWIRLVRIFLFTNIILLITSIFFSYQFFHLEIILTGFFLILSLLFRRLSYFSVLFSLFFYLSFLYWNINYLFILLGSLILGLLIVNFLKPEIEVKNWVYSLIPLAILLHVIWFNFLPFGFSATYSLDVGSQSDIIGDLRLVEGKGVGPRTCVEDKGCYREINTSVEIKFEPQVILDNNTFVEVSIDGDFKDDVYLQIGDDYYPIYIKEYAEKRPLYQIENIEVYGSKNNSQVYDIAKNLSNQEYIGPPKYYFYPTGNDYFDLDLSKPLEENDKFIVINESQINQFKCDGYGCIWNINQSHLKKDVLVVYGNPKYIDDAYEFDGIDDRLEILGSYDRFENDSFVVEAQFEAYDLDKDRASIVGHYNWEIMLDRNLSKITFGRMDSTNGPFIIMRAILQNDTKKVIVDYRKDNIIYTYLDDNKYFKKIPNQALYTEYGNQNLRIAMSTHGGAQAFEGTISKVSITKEYDSYIIKRKNNAINYKEKLVLVSQESYLLNSINMKLKKWLSNFLNFITNIFYSIYYFFLI